MASGPPGVQTRARSVDDRRFAELPDGHHLAAKIISEVLLPPQCTGGGVEADQIAIGAQGVDQPIGDGRRQRGPSECGGPTLAAQILARVGVDAITWDSSRHPAGLPWCRCARRRPRPTSSPCRCPRSSEELRALGGPVQFRPVSVQTPSPRGPRNSGQSAGSPDGAIEPNRTANGRIASGSHDRRLIEFSPQRIVKGRCTRAAQPHF